MHLLDRSEVIKASPAIQVQGKMTHLQRRVVECPPRERLRRAT